MKKKTVPRTLRPCNVPKRATPLCQLPHDKTMGLYRVVGMCYTAPTMARMIALNIRVPADFHALLCRMADEEAQTVSQMTRQWLTDRAEARGSVPASVLHEIAPHVAIGKPACTPRSRQKASSELDAQLDALHATTLNALLQAHVPAPAPVTPDDATVLHKGSNASPQPKPVAPSSKPAPRKRVVEDVPRVTQGEPLPLAPRVDTSRQTNVATVLPGGFGFVSDFEW